MLGRRAGGPETYEQQLLQALAAIDRHNEYHVWLLDQAAANALPLDQPNFVRHLLWPSTRSVSMAVSLPLALRRCNLSLLHATFAPPPICPVRLAMTMHGSVTFSHPYFYPPRVLARLNPLLRRGVRRAKLTVCVSDFVKHELMERFGLPEERLLTVYHGVNSTFKPQPPAAAAERVQRDHGLSNPYVIYVGKLHANKNIVRLIEAFDLATRGQEHVELVLVGRMFYGSDDIEQTVQRLGLAPRIHRLGHLPQDALPDLYAGAECMVFPTLWEGFGLPIIEAMACGAPVIASNIACVPEIAGNAAVLVDPLSTEAIATALADLLASPERRAELRARGLARAAEFTWERTARQTLQAYERLAAT
ncbi:glycosyltransferase family 4 protein [Roseateles sp. P5_E7]